MTIHIQKISARGGLLVMNLYSSCTLYSIRSITTRIRELLVRPGKNSLADGRQKINFELPKYYSLSSTIYKVVSTITNYFQTGESYLALSTKMNDELDCC